MTRPAVIVTGGEHVSVLATIRALDAAGYAPWVAVHGRGTYAGRSRAAAGVVRVPHPADDSRAFVDALASEASRRAAVAILPGTEVAMLALSEHADAIDPRVRLGIGTPRAIANATDKGLLGHFALEAGLCVPASVEVASGAVPTELPFPYPVVVKPRQSELRGVDGVVRHVGARIVRSAADLPGAIAAIPGGCGLVQPFLTGPLGSIAGVAWDGRLVAAIQARGERLWPMDCGSISSATTVALDPRLAAAVEALLRGVGWQGIFQIDVFERDGGYTIIDLNPRVYTSLGHATHAGLNLPGIWVDLLRGRAPVVPSGYRVGARYRHDEGDIRALAHMLRHGPRGAGVRGLLPRRDTTLAIFSPRDPAPSLTSLGRVARYVRRSRRSTRSRS